MIRVTIRPVDPNSGYATFAISNHARTTRITMLVDVTIDGLVLPTAQAGRLPDGQILLMYEPEASRHPRWEEAVQLIERQLKRYFELHGGVV